MKPLVIVRTAIQTIAVVTGAYLVLTGLANLARLFLGIAVILAGIGLGAAVNVVLKRRGEYEPPAVVVDPAEDRRLLRFLLQPEILIVVFGFFFNFFWEVSQIPMYTGINRGISYFGENTVEMKLFFVETFWRAAFLDALLVVGAHLLTMVILKSRFWFAVGGSVFGLTSARVRAGPVGVFAPDAHPLHEDRPHAGRRTAREPNAGLPADAQGRAPGTSARLTAAGKVQSWAKVDAAVEREKSVYYSPQSCPVTAAMRTETARRTLLPVSSIEVC